MTIERDAGALVALGWDSAFAASFAPLAEAGLTPARVVAEHRSGYVVADASGGQLAVLAGRFRHQASERQELPAVGDWVGVRATAGAGDGSTVIGALLPRRSAFCRKVAGSATAAQVVAANVDVALVATALPGDLNVRRLDRYLAMAWESGATPVVVLTKADLCSELDASLAAVRRAAPAVDVVAVSSVSDQGVSALDRHLAPGRTAVLIGSSGVGKSTLVNRLLGYDRLRTSEIGGGGRGRHTTTHRELVRLAGGALLVDTPGMRELQLWSADDGLDSAFADVSDLAGDCRFRDCQHQSEPGCAVRAAVDEGTLDGERLEHWRKLRRESAYLARRQDELARSAERARHKMLERASRAHSRRKYH